MNIEKILEYMKCNNSNLLRKIELEKEINRNSSLLPYAKIYNTPFFTPQEIENMELEYDKNTLVGDINIDKWFSIYKNATNGFITDEFEKTTFKWVNTVHRLYEEDKVKNRDTLLKLGWNPEIDFSIKNRIKASKRNKYMVLYNMPNIIDITELYAIAEQNNLLLENKNESNKYPVFIVLNYMDNIISKTISKTTKCYYSHASLGLDSNLKNLYSYNIKTNGFSIESIDEYIKTNKDSNIALFAIFVTKNQFDKIKEFLENQLTNKDKSKYGFLNILGILFNKNIERNHAMICSQFVDTIFKKINMFISDKPSGLVTPKDIYTSKSKYIYKIYEDNITKYNNKKVDNLIGKLINSNARESKDIISESVLMESVSDEITLDKLLVLDKNIKYLSEDNKTIYNLHLKEKINIYYYNEVTSPIVKFDNEGNLIMRSLKKINFESEYNKSHKLLNIYKKEGDIEAIKYEISRLWYINSLIEAKIYVNSSDKKENIELKNTRARILNDFNTFLKIVVAKEKDFNFDKYYNDTPFSNNAIIIDKNSIKYGTKMVKDIIKTLLY